VTGDAVDFVVAAWLFEFSHPLQVQYFRKAFARLLKGMHNRVSVGVAVQSLTLDQFKATVRAGGVTGVTLMAQGSGFFMKIATRAGQEPVVLAKARSSEPRRFGSPTSAMLVLRELGIRSAKMDFAQWDPEQKEVMNREAQKATMRAAHKAAADQRLLAADLLAAINDPRPSLSTHEVFRQFDEETDGAAAASGFPGKA
jgi:hypothetical protein